MLVTGWSKQELFRDRKSIFCYEMHSCNSPDPTHLNISISSFDHSNGLNCDPHKGKPMKVPAKINKETAIKYTYTVSFVRNDNVKWASRWDYILDSMPHTDIQVSRVKCFLMLSLLVVRNHELPGHRSLLVRDGRHDHYSLPSQGYRSLQLGWKVRRGSRGIWLEVGPRRRFPATKRTNALLCFVWFWDSNHSDDLYCPLFRLSRFLITCQSRKFGHYWRRLIHIYGNTGRIYFGTLVQDFWRWSMEKWVRSQVQSLNIFSKRSAHIILGEWPPIRHFLHHESDFVGRRLISRNSLYIACSCLAPVVWHFRQRFKFDDT